MTEPTWFRRPTADQPGTLNVSYQILDLPVVNGRAEQPVLVDDGPGPATVQTHAGLLEAVGALGGVLRGFGVEPGGRVLVDLDPGPASVLALLAVARVGAVAVVVPAGADDAGYAALLETATPLLVATDAHPRLGRAIASSGHAPSAVVVRGGGDLTPGRDLDWDLALRTGRTDPAGAEAVPADAPSVLGWSAADLMTRSVREQAERVRTLADGELPVPVATLDQVLRGR